MPSPALTPAQQDQAWTAWRTGQSVRSIARDIGEPTYRVSRYFGATGGVRVHPAGRSSRHLSLVEREEISRGLAAGLSLRRIAAALGRPACTVSREVARNGGREAYRAHGADSAASRCRPSEPYRRSTSRGRAAALSAGRGQDVVVRLVCQVARKRMASREVGSAAV
ncbi:helix-turn-helix domain-containing protein [Pseudokineococcus lusitanus]|uniref:helix-turn-helix domain-containing protein n=1 Tax=Nocardioides kribbensis TaxID=305517 RepID=UPI001319F617